MYECMYVPTFRSLEVYTKTYTHSYRYKIKVRNGVDVAELEQAVYAHLALTLLGKRHELIYSFSSYELIKGQNGWVTSLGIGKLRSLKPNRYL